MVPMKLVYLVIYRDKNAKMFAGTCWNAYTFDTPEERDMMVADLNDPKSVWKDEAVTIVVSEIMVPLVAVLPDGSENMDFSAFDGSVE